MCCVKILGKIELEFTKELYGLVKGDYVRFRFHDHDGNRIGEPEHSVHLTQKTVIISFGKPPG